MTIVAARFMLPDFEFGGVVDEFELVDVVVMVIIWCRVDWCGDFASNQKKKTVHLFTHKMVDPSKDTGLKRVTCRIKSKEKISQWNEEK